MTSLENKFICDVLIIGGGPTGLFTAFYAGMRNMSVKVIESMPQLGGQLTALYPEKYIYDVAGFPKITAQKLVDQLVEQCKMFNPQFLLEEKVLNLHKKNEQLFEITTDKDMHLAKSVIITAGCGAFQPRKLGIEYEKFETTNLHYFVKDKSNFKNKDILIAGGGDSALDWSLMLEPIADSVTLVHRRDKFRAHEHTLNQLLNSKVTVKTPCEISSLHGCTNITQANLLNTKTNETEILDVDDVIVSFGFVSSLGPILDWGLEIVSGNIVVDSRMETSIAGVYAAGDIATYAGKVKLIAVGFGEAPTAVNNAKLYIDPNARLQPGHSSNMKV